MKEKYRNPAMSAINPTKKKHIPMKLRITIKALRNRRVK
jgi:hypothetical protein